MEEDESTTATATAVGGRGRRGTTPAARDGAMRRRRRFDAIMVKLWTDYYTSVFFGVLAPAFSQHAQLFQCGRDT